MGLLKLLAIIAVFVFVHELGHFLSARYFGMKVLRFSIFFWTPNFLKRILTFNYKGTEYKLGLIPLGGYTTIKGMGKEEPYQLGSNLEREMTLIQTIIDRSKRILEEDKEANETRKAALKRDIEAAEERIRELNNGVVLPHDNNDEDAYINKPLWQRAIVIFAGSGFNFIFAAIFYLFFLLFGANLLLAISHFMLLIGALNLLPAIMLDGNKLLFIFIEMIRKKPIQYQTESLITLAITISLLVGYMYFF